MDISNQRRRSRDSSSPEQVDLDLNLLLATPGWRLALTNWRILLMVLALVLAAVIGLIQWSPALLLRHSSWLPGMVLSAVLLGCVVAGSCMVRLERIRRRLAAGVAACRSAPTAAHRMQTARRMLSAPGQPYPGKQAARWTAMVVGLLSVLCVTGAVMAAVTALGPVAAGDPALLVEEATRISIVSGISYGGFFVLTLPVPLVEQARLQVKRLHAQLEVLAQKEPMAELAPADRHAPGEQAATSSAGDSANLKQIKQAAQELSVELKALKEQLDKRSTANAALTARNVAAVESIEQKQEAAIELRDQQNRILSAAIEAVETSRVTAAVCGSVISRAQALTTAQQSMETKQREISTKQANASRLQKQVAQEVKAGADVLLEAARTVVQARAALAPPTVAEPPAGLWQRLFG